MTGGGGEGDCQVIFEVDEACWLGLADFRATNKRVKP